VSNDRKTLEAKPKPQGDIRGRDHAPVAATEAGAVLTQTRDLSSLRYLTAVPRAHHVVGVEASAAVQNNTAAIIMEHGWKRWLGVCAAATVLAGGLASIFHRDNATVLPQERSGHCSGACPCGTI
jgi:hypothetical protein